MMRFMVTILGVFVLPALLWAAPAGANAPSRTALFIDLEGTMAIAKKHFSARDVAAMGKRLTEHVTPRTGFINPYGDDFVGFGRSGGEGFYALGRAFSVVWAVSCKNGDCEAFKKFLAELGKRTRIRAMNGALRSSGCAEATFGFAGAPGQSATLSIRLTLRQFFNCRPVTRKLISEYTFRLQ